MSLLVYVFVLCLYLHGCTARPLMIVSDKGSDQPSKFELSIKDVKSSVAEKLATQLGKLTRTNHANPLNYAVIQSHQDMISGIEIKIPYSLKISQQANSEREVSKRAERSTLESPPKSCKVEESVNNNSKDESVEEEIVVMDYAQPHRKPPIHNRGT